MSMSLDNTSMMSHANKDVSKVDDENGQLLDSSEDWIAVKPFVLDKCVNLNNEIVNIVSISVEKEKILIVSREHNRRVTDDESTKQWYGI